MLDQVNNLQSFFNAQAILCPLDSFMHGDVPFHCYIYILPLFSASHLDDLLNEGTCVLIACLSELPEEPDYVVRR